MKRAPQLRCSFFAAAKRFALGSLCLYYSVVLYGNI